MGAHSGKQSLEDADVKHALSRWHCGNRSCGLFQLMPLQATERMMGVNGVCGDGEVHEVNGEECDDGNKVVTDDCVGESRDPRNNSVNNTAS